MAMKTYGTTPLFSSVCVIVVGVESVLGNCIILAYRLYIVWRSDWEPKVAPSVGPTVVVTASDESNLYIVNH